MLGLIIGWFGHKAVSTPPDVATVSVYQDWRIACPASTDKETSCEIRQDVLEAKSHSELASLSIFRIKGAATMVVTVPYNVLLDPGIGLQFGTDKPRVYPFEVCNEVGCLVRVPFDDSLAKAMSAAAAAATPGARILLVGMDGKPAALPFSLKGYKDVYHVFDSTEAKRHSWWRRLWS
ncbi:MAG TPA: invasion associated locus B family protein [Rhizomicrobium sp.]|nr:invasion associated locus B family protein [Rhizomicrobium sp.]